MIRIAAYLLVGIGIGFGFAYWQSGRDDPVGTWDASAPLAESGSIEKRLRELESSLALERYERQALADELAALRRTTTQAPPAVADGGEQLPDAPRERQVATRGRGDDPAIEQRLRERFASGSLDRGPLDQSILEQRRIQRLVDAGLPPDRAQWILQREEELEMELLQRRYDAAQGGASPEEIARLDQSTLLRQELGDADYEKYLAGLGRPTTVAIRDVLANSPAQAAGLQPGDEIVAYAGKRVFDMDELSELTYAGRPGETVPVEVLRDGQPMQVYLSRGPIGVSGGGRQSVSSRR